MRIGSLCSGVGGLELGLERAGVGKVVWQVEIDERCRKVLARHWPDAKRYSDLRSVGAANLEKVDVICGGIPCQPASQAGKRKGTADDRWLWPDALRIVDELKPKYVIFENVPGLLTLEGGEAFRRILRALAESGYDCEWSYLRASDVGAPHRRERVFIIAWRRDLGLAHAPRF